MEADDHQCLWRLFYDAPHVRAAVVNEGYLEGLKRALYLAEAMSNDSVLKGAIRAEIAKREGA